MLTFTCNYSVLFDTFIILGALQYYNYFTSLLIHVSPDSFIPFCDNIFMIIPFKYFQLHNLLLIQTVLCNKLLILFIVEMNKGRFRRCSTHAHMCLKRCMCLMLCAAWVFRRWWAVESQRVAQIAPCQTQFPFRYCTWRINKLWFIIKWFQFLFYFYNYINIFIC